MSSGGKLAQFNSIPKWSPVGECCQIGAILINRIADIEDVPFPAHVIYPGATPEIIANLREILAPRHFGNKPQDLLLSFHSLQV